MDGDDMGDPNLDTLLTSREAAALLRVSERTLERLRTAGTGPQFVRLCRAVRYRHSDLVDHIEANLTRSTSEPPRSDRTACGGASLS
jgi:predicted DNA-binding transcriptional regulator AlpA